jgi:hypothetical protein
VTPRRALLIGPCPGSRGQGEHRGLLVQGLVREPFDATGETVSIHCAPVDAAVRRVRVVLDGQLHHPRDIIVGQPGRQLQRRVDTGRHPSAGQVPAVGHPSLRHECRAEPVEEAVIGPVRGGAVPLQGAGGGQEHRGDPLGTAIGLAPIIQQDGTHQLPQGGRATSGNDHDVRLGKLIQRRRRGHPYRGVGEHRVEMVGDHHVMPRLHAINPFGDFQTGYPWSARPDRGRPRPIAAGGRGAGGSRAAAVHRAFRTTTW